MAKKIGEVLSKAEALLLALKGEAAAEKSEDGSKLDPLAEFEAAVEEFKKLRQEYSKAKEAYKAAYAGFAAKRGLLQEKVASLDALREKLTKKDKKTKRTSKPRKKR